MEKSTSFREQYRFLSNFFQYPFVFKGLQYPNAESAFQAQKCTNEAEQLIIKAEKEATIIVDYVIDILKPNCIVFTSCDAWKAYIKNNGKYTDDERMIYTSHSGMPVSWCKRLASLNYQRGIDVFESGLKRIYNK